jgi:hypothetical protein
MEIRYLLLLVVLLSACKKESGGDGIDDPSQDPLPEYPFNFDVVTPGGMEIQTNGLYAPDPNEADIWYEETLQCVKQAYIDLSMSGFAEYDAPPVVIVEDVEDLCALQPGYNGVFCTNYETPLIGLDRIQGAPYENQWKHEFIHYILFMNEFDNEMNLNHQPQLIWDCQS